MSILGKLLGFRGRLRRRDFWLLGIAVLVLAVVVQWAIQQFLGAPPLPLNTGTLAERSAAYNAAQQASSTRFFVSIAAHILFLWPSLAISIKRAHDIDNRAFVVIAFYLLLALLPIVAFVTAIAGWMSLHGGAPETNPILPFLMGSGAVAIVLGVIVALWALYLLVTLGFYDGTRGPNRFGPSPKHPNAETAFA